MKKVERTAIQLMLPSIEKKFRGKEFKAAAEYVFKGLNVEPVYLQKDNPEFGKLREDLNTRAGVIISNHPCNLDTFAILSGLERKDIKIMAQESVAPALKKSFGEDMIVSSSSNPSELRAILKKITDFISNGGLFLIYPTGGEEKETGEIKFRSFFGSLVKRINPDVMVYCFFLNEEDSHNINRQLGRKAGLASGIVLSEYANLNYLKETANLRIEEECTRASEWQKLLGGKRKDENARLTDHYLDIFKRS